MMRLHRLSLLVLLQWGAIAAAAQEAAPVAVSRAVIAPVYEEIPLAGSVASPRVSRLSPRVNGLVEAMLVEKGDEVKRGDALVQLDPELAEIDLARARAQVQEAEARWKDAQRRASEARELVTQKNIARTAFESVQAEVEISAAVLQRLRQELLRQEELLQRHVVKAPFDGVVVARLAEAGEWVDTGTPLVQLAEIDVVRVEVPVPQHYFSHVEQGTEVRIRFDAFPQRSFDGRVSIIVPSGAQNTRTFPVSIDVDNHDRIIAPGMSARVFLQLRQSGTGQALLVPRDAIVRSPDGSATVWVVDGDGGSAQARAVQVQTGRSYRDNVEITSGNVHAGDKVVVRGNELLRAGQVVQVREEYELNL